MDHANTSLPATLTAPDAFARLAIDDGLAVITLNRPHAHNVLDIAMSHAAPLRSSRSCRWCKPAACAWS